jgi:hypothetical protein
LTALTAAELVVTVLAATSPAATGADVETRRDARLRGAASAAGVLFSVISSTRFPY